MRKKTDRKAHKKAINGAEEDRPMFMEQCPRRSPRASTSLRIQCCDWDAEAALRMLNNNLDEKVALDWKQLIIYGGSGRAARNWREYHRIVQALKALKKDETLCIQSGKPVYIGQTHPDAPRVIIANSNLVPAWATQEEFDRLDRLGLMMYGQMTAGSWIYIGTQGILQGTYETFGACAQKNFSASSLLGRWIFTSGLGNMGGAQPLAGTMNEACILVAEVNPRQIERRLAEGYLDRATDSLNQALNWIDQGRAEKRPVSVGLLANGAAAARELLRLRKIPDIVTDQTSAHNLMDYVPEGGEYDALMALRQRHPKKYRERSLATLVEHARALVGLKQAGAVVFDYGNNLRGQAEKGGLSLRDRHGHFVYPGFVPEYIRGLFSEGQGPFRWALLSGRKKDLHAVDQAVLETFPEKAALRRKGAETGAGARFADPRVLARLRRALADGPGDEPAGGQGDSLRAHRHRPRSSRLRQRRLAQPRDRGHEGPERRRGGLAVAQLRPERRVWRELGELSSRRRSGHRQFAACRNGDRGRRQPQERGAAKARAGQRPRPGRRPPRRCGL